VVLFCRCCFWLVHSARLSQSKEILCL
jgi:G:T-mismatch repair DNA endonuclease (very short patch repair protein)